MGAFSMPAAADQHADPNLRHLIQTSDASAHISITELVQTEEIRQVAIDQQKRKRPGPVGIVVYTVRADVRESFTGDLASAVEFTIEQEVGYPPPAGQHLVFLVRSQSGAYQLAERSGPLMRPTPDALGMAREYREVKERGGDWGIRRILLPERPPRVEIVFPLSPNSGSAVPSRPPMSLNLRTSKDSATGYAIPRDIAEASDMLAEMVPDYFQNSAIYGFDQFYCHEISGDQDVPYRREIYDLGWYLEKIWALQNRGASLIGPTTSRNYLEDAYFEDSWRGLSLFKQVWEWRHEKNIDEMPNCTDLIAWRTDAGDHGERARDPLGKVLSEILAGARAGRLNEEQVTKVVSKGLTGQQYAELFWTLRRLQIDEGGDLILKTSPFLDSAMWYTFSNIWHSPGGADALIWLLQRPGANWDAGPSLRLCDDMMQLGEEMLPLLRKVVAKEVAGWAKQCSVHIQERLIYEQQSYALIDDYYALIEAVDQGDVAKVRELLEQGVPVNARVPLGNKVGSPWAPAAERSPPLYVAVVNGNASMVKMLLPYSPYLNWQCCGSSTALGEAAEIGNAEIVELLLQAGASPRKAASTGETPLDLAKRNQHEEVVRLLEAFP